MKRYPTLYCNKNGNPPDGLYSFYLKLFPKENYICVLMLEYAFAIGSTFCSLLFLIKKSAFRAVEIICN